MATPEIRWLQRFANYRKALEKMRQAVKIVCKPTPLDRERIPLNAEIDDLLQEGLIQRFEYTHELAGKVMKDYAEYQGYTDIRGSRDAIRKALEMGLIDDKQWMEMIADRNLTSHNYDDDRASGVLKHIAYVYFPLFCRFEEKMLSLPGVQRTLFDV